MEVLKSEGMCEPEGDDMSQTDCYCHADCVRLGYRWHRVEKLTNCKMVIPITPIPNLKNMSFFDVHRGSVEPAAQRKWLQ
jgi:hypothetical protein